VIPQDVRARIAATLVICAIFAFAGDGLSAYFAPDDMMNLYGAWSTSAANVLQGDRPLGTLVYRGLFAMFGLNPLPYRVFCFSLMLANTGLLFVLCLGLTGKREVGVLACLIGAYHAHLADLYYSSGTAYDLLCYLFTFLTLVVYMRIRESGRYPTWRQDGVLLILYLCALGSKEIAVVLPLYVTIYEWLYHSEVQYPWPHLSKWLLHGAQFLWVSVPITVLYVVLKLTSPHSMTANPAYAPHISMHVFMARWKFYLTDLFYGSITFSSAKVIMLWAILLGLAVLARRRELIFAWCVILAGALPFIFIAPRGFFVMYSTLPGWYLYAGASFVLIRDWLLQSLPRWAKGFGVRPEQLVLFATVAVLLVPLHWREKAVGSGWPIVAEAHLRGQVRPVLEDLARQHLSLPRGAKVLILSDPYPVDEWMLTFMFRLHYRDKEIRVDRAKVWPELAQAAVRAQYDRVFVLDAEGLRAVGRTE
jgi:hypothetical protein